MKTVKAKWTLMTAEGRKEAGDTWNVTNSVAEKLEADGSVEVTGDAKDEEEQPKEKSEVSITDNTSKEKKQITKPTTKK